MSVGLRLTEDESHNSMGNGEADHLNVVMKIILLHFGSQKQVDQSLNWAE